VQWVHEERVTTRADFARAHPSSAENRLIVVSRSPAASSQTGPAPGRSGRRLPGSRSPLHDAHYGERPTWHIFRIEVENGRDI
jgi:hypothetical protein